MLRIAVCDDDLGALSNITALFDQYQQSKNVTIKLQLFHNAIELLESLHSNSYDLLMLDVLMPGLNGIQAAREIRSNDSFVPLVFLTSSPEFALDSYSVEAFSYLLKPASALTLFPLLDRLQKKILLAGESLPITSANGIIRLHFSQIEYLEVNRKHLIFYMEDGSFHEIPGTLAEYEPKFLSKKSFVKVHRSYIANLSHIKALETGALITYNGKSIPVARGLMPQVRQQYADFLFEEG